MVFGKPVKNKHRLLSAFNPIVKCLKFVQAATTVVADLVIERGKNAFLENTPALVWCDFLELGRLFFSQWGLTRRRLGEVAKVLPDLHEPIASGPA